jgi:putative RecB family exonuclease
MISTPAAERPVSPPRRDYLSYSAVTTYQRCPLAFHFRYVAGLPEATVSSSLVFGGAVHRAFEHHFNELLAGAEPPSIDALLGEYDAAWQEYDANAVRFGKEQRDDLTSLAQRMLAAFQASSLARPEGMILGIEEELRGPIVPGCPDILGRLDLVVETIDELIVTDLKTARSRWSQAQFDESARQLLLYHDLARSLSPRKRLRLQFAVLTKAKQPAIGLHEVPANRQQIDRTKRIVERVWRAIEAESYFPTPSPMNCPSCPFRKPCRAWKG